MHKLRNIIFTLAVLAFTVILSFSCSIPGTGDPEDTYGDTIESGETQEENVYYVLALTNLNVRETPTTAKNNVLGTLKQNAVALYIKSYDDNWYEVEYSGQTAYVSAQNQYSRLIEDDELLSEEDIRAALIESVIDAGKEVLGTPYEYGAPRLLNEYSSLNPYFTGETFDCSSFVQYAFYTGAGIALQSDSRSQSLFGTQIAFTDLERGDIIFMTSTARMYNTGIERIGHVAIYLGDNKIIHTFGTGGVRIQTYSAFWQDRFILARRMI